jgi:adenine specific DNA methylase Mod
VNARIFAVLIRRNEQDYRKKTEKIRKIFRTSKKEYTQIIAIFMKNINKALSKLDQRDPVSNNEKVRKKFPKELKGLERCFNDDKGTAIFPHRSGKDHAIPLEKDEQGRERDVPWGPLYGMSRKELLVLRKTLTDLLNKGWI